MKKKSAANTVEMIMNLALDHNERAEEKLNQLIQSGISIHLMRDENTLFPSSAVSLLAENGHEEAVLFLIEKYGASLKDAMAGAALGKQKAIILKLFVLENDPEKVKNLFCTFCAVNIKDLLNYEDKQNIISAFGYLKQLPPAKTVLFRMLLTNSTEAYRNEIMPFALTDFYGQSMPAESHKMLYNFIVENKNLTELQLDKALSPLFRIMGLVEGKSKSRLALSNEIFLNFNLAQIWHQSALHFWFLSGLDKVRDKTFPIEIFLHISAYAFSTKNIILSQGDITQLFNKHIHVVPKMLHDTAYKNVEKKYTGNLFQVAISFFKPSLKKDLIEKENKEKAQIDARYQRRITY